MGDFFDAVLILLVVVGLFALIFRDMRLQSKGLAWKDFVAKHGLVDRSLSGEHLLDGSYGGGRISLRVSVIVTETRELPTMCYLVPIETPLPEGLTIAGPVHLVLYVEDEERGRAARGRRRP